MTKMFGVRALVRQSAAMRASLALLMGAFLWAAIGVTTALAMSQTCTDLNAHWGSGITLTQTDIVGRFAPGIHKLEYHLKAGATITWSASASVSTPGSVVATSTVRTASNSYLRGESTGNPAHSGSINASDSFTLTADDDVIIQAYVQAQDDNYLATTASVTITASCSEVEAVVPTITTVSPTTGSTAGGGIVTITGSNFTGATRVTFDGAAGSNLAVVSDSQITVEAPAHAAGAVDVEITAPGGTVTATGGFTYEAPIPAPTITSIELDRADFGAAVEDSTLGGAVVMLTGTGFTGATSVTFGGTAVTKLEINSGGTRMLVAAPPHTAGIVDVVVNAPGGMSNAVNFTYKAAGAVITTQPTSQTVQVGDGVTLRVVAENAVSYQWQSGGSAAVSWANITSPSAKTSELSIASTTKNHNGARYRVRITDAAGITIYSETANLTVLAAAPTISGLSPDTGSTAGGDTVTITGTGFTGATRVTFGGTAGSNLTVVSDTQINVDTPSEAAGEVDVVVTTPSGDSGAGSYTYQAATVAPVIISQPQHQSGGDGESVTFSVAANNAAHYQWQVLSPVGTWNAVPTSVYYAGANSAALTFSPGIHASALSGYRFRVVVFGVDDEVGTPSEAATYTYVPGAPALALSPADGMALTGGTVGSAYSQAFTASGGTGRYTFSITGGVLPAGLTLATDGTLSGTPTAIADASFTVTATDASTPANTGTASYTLKVVEASVVTFTFTPASGSGLKAAMASEDYSQQISATGGTGALVYSLASGELPKGVILNVSTGELTGPLADDAEVKDYSFAIKATDANNATGTANYTLKVTERTVAVTNKSLDVPAGSTPTNVNLEDGATGGPFSSAELTFVEPADAGTASIVRGEFAAVGPTPLGWYLKFVPNPAFSGTVKVGFKLTSALGASNTGTVTYKLSYDPAQVAADIDGLVNGFVQARQNLISSTIKVPGLLERRQMENATDPVTARVTPSETGVTASFSTSLAQMEAARDGADGISDGYASPFNLWIDGTFMLHNRKENDNRWGSFGIVNLGADFLLTDNALIGLSFHFDRMTDPTKDDAELTGNGWLVGPYASLEIGKGVFWDTSLLYGGSANDIDTAFWDGSFDTTRWMIDTLIKGDWNLDEATTLTPKLRVVYFSETIDDYSVRNSAGNELGIDGFDEEQFRVSLGAELARSFTLESGMVLTPKLGVSSGLSGLDGTGAFGSVSAGLSLQTANDWAIEAGLLFNVEGDGQTSVGATAGVSGRF